MKTIDDIMQAINYDTMIEVGRLAVQQRHERDRLERERLAKIRAARERRARRNKWENLFPAIKGV